MSLQSSQFAQTYYGSSDSTEWMTRYFIGSFSKILVILSLWKNGWDEKDQLIHMLEGTQNLGQNQSKDLWINSLEC